MLNAEARMHKNRIENVSCAVCCLRFMLVCPSIRLFVIVVEAKAKKEEQKNCSLFEQTHKTRRLEGDWVV